MIEFNRVYNKKQEMIIFEIYLNRQENDRMDSKVEGKLGICKDIFNKRILKYFPDCFFYLKLKKKMRFITLKIKSLICLI